jgi:maleate cis-trans isomerase
MEDEKWKKLLQPRFRYGNIEPPGAGVRRGGYMFYRLVPMDVMEISIGLGIKEYTPEGVEEAIANFWNCVDALAHEKVDCIILGGVPVSSQLGRARVQELAQQVKERTGIPMDAPVEAIIAGLNHLGAKRVTVASRWADQLNARLTEYLQSAGIEVMAMTSRGQWGKQAFAMSLEEGLQMALDVGREAGNMAPEADAIVVPGGSALSLHTIPALEDEFHKPVLTNLNAEVWNDLVRPGVIEPVRGWGQLLASK